MKKILLVIGLILAIGITPCYSANEWRKGTGEDVILGTENVSDIDAVSFENIVEPTDRMLSKYRENLAITYLSTSTITVGAGQVMCSNSDGSVRKMRSNPSATTVTWSDLDTGAEASSTTYYLYASADADAETFTVKISANSSSPSGVTSFKRLGSFFNNSSSNILNDETVTNDNDYYSIHLGDWVSRTIGTNYQAASDGFVVSYMIIPVGGGGSAGDLKGLTDASTPPTTLRGQCSGTLNREACMVAFPVKKSDYYKVTLTDGGGNTTAMFFLPNE